MVDDMVLDALEIRGERRKYAKKYGVDALIGVFHGLPWKDEKAEEVYQICNERGITWQEYYGINTNEKVIN